MDVNNDWLTRPTGDPFLDCGGKVIEELKAITNINDIRELIKVTADFFVNKLNSPLNSFFLNSKITNPAYTGNSKITETIDYFNRLIDNSEEHIEGYCRVMGEKTNLFRAGRENFILAGSAKFINFHPNLADGMYVCKEALIRMFFVPLGVQYLLGKLAIIQSNSLKISELFIKHNVNYNFTIGSINPGQELKRSAYSSAGNALFEFASDCIQQIKDEEELDKPNITLYLFSNFGADPSIEIHQFPAELFVFYRTIILSKYKNQWNNFINVNYSSSKFRDAKYDNNNNVFTALKGKTTEIISYDDFKIWRNRIYTKLLLGNSILYDILKFVKDNEFDFIIVKLYQRLIKGMELKTLEKIESLAEHIIKDTEQLKKNITRLNSARKSYELRAFLISLIKKNYEAGNKLPLITLNEYVNYLLPDGSSWSEIRDLLLISVYQKAHEKGVMVEVPEEELQSPEENEGVL